MTSAHYGTNAYAAARAGGTDDELIRRYSHVVRRTANHLSSRTGVSADELWSAGALGILEAARRYDPSKGVKLEAFIAYRVRGAMLDELRRMDRLPRRLRNKLAEIDRVRRTLAQQLGREPEREELAAAAGIDASELLCRRRTSTWTRWWCAGSRRRPSRTPSRSSPSGIKWCCRCATRKSSAPRRSQHSWA
jgi:RNA polymerase sigma factor for flagellar operon FliA